MRSRANPKVEAAAAMRLRGDHAGAEAVLRSVVVRYPDDKDALGMLGAVLTDVGKENEAEQILRRALQLGAGPAACNLGLGICHRARGMNQEAIALYRLALGQDPRLGEGWLRLGEVLGVVGTPREASEALVEAMRLMPSDPRPRHHLLELTLQQLRDLLFANGDYANALQQHRLLLAARNHDASARVTAMAAVKSLKDWCEATGAPYSIARPAEKYQMPIPRFAGEPGSEKVAVDHPEAFVAELSNARVVGGASAILADEHTALLDLGARSEADERYEFRNEDARGGVIVCSGKRHFLIDVPQRAEQTIDAGIMLCGTASYNYFHWLFEFLPRLSLAKGGSFVSLPLLVDRVCRDVPQLLESLTAYAGSRRALVFLEPQCAYRVRHLVVPSPLAWVVPSFKPGIRQRYADLLISPEAVRFLRQGSARLLEAGRGGASPERIYISRKAQQLRRTNEEELEELFASRGFDIVRPEGLSFAEQLRVFSRADVIAGPNGSGLANIVFASPGTKVLCLMGERMDNACLSNIAAMAGLDILYVEGIPRHGDASDQLHAQFDMPIPRVRAGLDELLAR